MIKVPDFLTFQPVFKERIWGGRELEKLDFKIPEGTIGECWGISAHPHGMSIVDQGHYKGMTLEEIYRQYPKWFNQEKKQRFPLLIKILDAREDLSVQVHPNDEYALKHEKDYGKHEAWYVLNARPQTRIQIGHHITTRTALNEAISKSQWSTLLHYYPAITKGDVIDIPPGTLHALCGGSLIFEVQQSSDVTYRVFDYNRVDKEGNKRELHLTKALDVIKVPDHSHSIQNSSTKYSNQFVTLVKNDKFLMKYLNKNSQPFILQNNNYLCGYLLTGSLKINGKTINQNQFFVIPSKNETRLLEGEFEGLFVESLI